MTATRIPELIGQQMSAVAFVQDYVELHFDGKILRALANPMVTVGGASFKFPGPGSRDALCALIGRTVVNVVVHEGDRIDLQFDGGALVRIPLAQSEEGQRRRTMHRRARIARGRPLGDSYAYDDLGNLTQKSDYADAYGNTGRTVGLAGPHAVASVSVAGVPKAMGGRRRINRQAKKPI